MPPILRRAGWLPVALIKVTQGFHHVPAVLFQVEAFQPVAVAIEQGQPFRAQHPLVSVGHNEIGLAGLDVERFYAQTLNGIHTKCYAMLPAGGAYRGEVQSQPGGVLYGTE